MVNHLIRGDMNNLEIMNNLLSKEQWDMFLQHPKYYPSVELLYCRYRHTLIQHNKFEEAFKIAIIVSSPQLMKVNSILAIYIN